MRPLPAVGEGCSAAQQKRMGEGDGSPPHPIVHVEHPALPSPAAGRGRSNNRRCQSCGSSLISAAPWLLPTQNVGGVVLLSTNTRRTLAWWRGGYSGIFAV